MLNLSHCLLLLTGLPAVAGESLQLGLAHHFPQPHSSTMVGAFITLFLSVIENNKTTKTLTSVQVLLPTTTILVKQIALFSTSSHLGLVIVTIGISQPHLAFIHVCTSAF